MKHILKLTTMALSAVTLAVVGCTAPEAPEAEAEAEGAMATFTCPAGETIAAVFSADGDEVAVVLPEETDEMILPRVEAASGSKYSDGTTTFWEKGGEALVEVNGETAYESCTAG